MLYIMDQARSFLNGENGKRNILFLALAIFVIILLPLALSGSQRSSQNTSNQTGKSSLQNLSSHTIVYGVWSGESSVIKGIDLNSGNQYILAKLPSNIKKVTVLDANRLLYIDKTDEKDHGREIAIYNIKEQKSTPLFSTAADFGIDDYAISPNKRYLATWEVQASGETNTLLNGKSRVHSIDISAPSTKHLLYDEVSTAVTPVHYPSAVLDDGRVFMDSFLPNAGAGWAYGMSVSNFDGTNKRNLDTMQNGTYSTQPKLSQDGKMLVFAGYDGTKGSGISLNQGFRQALVSPNTVETLDTATLARKKLPNLSNQNIYGRVNWDVTGNVIYSQTEPGAQDSAYYRYIISQNTAQEISPNASSESSLITQLSPSLALVGKNNESESAIGNLGSTYSTSYTALSLVNTSTGKTTPLQLEDSAIQYITTTAHNYFAALTPIQKTTTPEDSKTAQTQLQLKTFTLKPSLAPVRKTLQSDPPPPPPVVHAPTAAPNQPAPTKKPKENPNNCTKDTCPRCYDLAQAQCEAAGDPAKATDQSYCRGQKMKELENAGVCYDSPLYLYGPEGTEVDVTIHTPIFNADPSSDGRYAVTLLKNGKMHIAGNTYESIAFDYLPAISASRPTRGVITSLEKMQDALQFIATALGMNQKETQDLMQFAHQQINSPYVFISFFDNNLSKQILPISFRPTPDSYHNIVFYFKRLDTKPALLPLPPHFEKIERKGFTAVEISEVVE